MIDLPSGWLQQELNRTYVSVLEKDIETINEDIVLNRKKIAFLKKTLSKLIDLKKEKKKALIDIRKKLDGTT